MDKQSDGAKKDIAMIPFASYTFLETKWHRRFIAILIVIVFIVGGFLAVYTINENRWKALLADNEKQWKELFAEYDYSSSEVVVDGKDGIASYIGNDGDINYGENNSEDTNSP